MKAPRLNPRHAALVPLLCAATGSWAGTAYTTQPASNITATGAQLNGSAASTLGLSGEKFEYGKTTRYGMSAMASPQGVNGPVSASIGSLDCNTTYHFRFVGDPKPPRTTLQGVDMSFVTAACPTPVAIQGFTGPFTPANWQTGSNAPVNLINTSSAPSSVTLSNYAPWRASGATFSYPKAPASGTISFSYSLNGATTACPGSYAVNNQPIQLSGNGQTVTVKVAAGDSFTFALNGANLPNNFGCVSNGNPVSLTISDFVFTQM